MKTFRKTIALQSLQRDCFHISYLGVVDSETFQNELSKQKTRISKHTQNTKHHGKEIIQVFI